MSLVVLLAPLAAAQDLEILLLGNSYSLYNELPTLVGGSLQAGVPAWDEVATEGLAQGGMLLRDHLSRADGSEGDTAWREALVTGDTAWDLVVLQEQSQIPGFDETSSDLQESWAAAAGLDTLIQAKGADTAFLMTWGRRDGDAQNQHIYPDYTAMQDRLTAGYLGYVERLATDDRPVWIIPAGLAWQRIHDDLVDDDVDPAAGDTLFTRLYVADGSHPSIQGSTLVAATALVALTGRSAVGLPGPGSIEAGELAALQEAADRAVFDDPLGEAPYPWAWTWETWAKTSAPEHIDQGALRPWVRVATFGVSLTDLTIGDGRLQVVEGAGIGVFGTLKVGQDGPGALWIEGGSAIVGDLVLDNAEVRLTGGTLAADSVTWEGDGRFVMTGGDLIVGTFGGDLDQQGGQLVAGNPVTITGSWTFGSEAEFLLEGPAGTVQIGNNAVLAGTFDVSNGALGNVDEVVLVDAASIEAADLVVPEPPDWTVVLRDGGAGQQLVLVPPPGLGGDSARPTDTDEEGSWACACSAGSSAVPWIWLLVPWWRRR